MKRISNSNAGVINQYIILKQNLNQPETLKTRTYEGGEVERMTLIFVHEWS